MKQMVKTGLYFGGFMAVFYIANGLLEADELTPKKILIQVTGGLIGGAVAGLFFAFVMHRVLIWTKPGIDNAFKELLEPGEELVFETPANHKRGIEAVGGKLFLTNKRLIFASHKINIQNHSTILNRSEILSAEKYSHILGLMKNGLKIKTLGGEEKFIVTKVDEWVGQFTGQQHFSRL